MRCIRSLSIPVFLLFSILTGIATLHAQEGAAATDTLVYAPGESIRLGISIGLSGEGIAPLGVDILRGVELAQEKAPTVTVGSSTFTIQLDIQDSQCSAEGGVAVANRFSSDPSVVGVIGPMCSSACLPASYIYDAAGYSTISPSCTAASLSRRGSTSFNRTSSSDLVQGRHTAQYIYETLGIRRLATIHDGSPYAEGLVAYFSELYGALGGEIVAADALTVGDTQFQTLLARIAEHAPELIYFPGFPAEAARLIEQRYDAGLEEIIFFGGAAWKGPEVIELAGAAAAGVYAVGPVSIAGDADLEERRALFLERYEETYGETPPQSYHFNAHDAYDMFQKAIAATGTLDEKGNLRLSRADIAAFLRNYQSTEALLGPIACDGRGDCVVASTGVFQVQDGVFELLTVVSGEGERKD